MRYLFFALLSVTNIGLAATPAQALQEDFRAHPWRMPLSNISATRTETPTALVTPTAAPAAVVAAKNTAVTPTKAAASTVVSKGKWEIQLGSLSSADAAEKRKDELEALTGKGIRVVPHEGTWKLRFGSYPDKKAASKARDDLKKKNVEGFPVEL